MKTLLVFPRVEARKPHGTPPLGTAQLAAELREKGFEVSLADLTFSTWDDYVRVLKKTEPDILGVSALSLYLEPARISAAIAKARNENIITVFGGPHPSIAPEWMVNRPEVDIVCVGESDETLPELVDHLEKGKDLSDVKGIWYKNGGRIKENEPRPFIEDLDKLPFAARDLLPMKKYLKRPPVPLLSSPCGGFIFQKGCPYNCSFCQPTSQKMWGVNQRKVSVARAMEEIIKVSGDYNLSSINCHDDTFTADRGWAMEFAQKMREEKLGLDFVINTRVNLIDRELVRQFKSAGCIQIIFGVESGSNRVLKEVLNKGITTELVEKAFNICHEEGVMARANIMLGSPTETAEEMNQTRELLRRIKPDSVIVSTTCPMFGTHLYDNALKDNLIDETKYDGTTFSRGVLRGVDYDMVDKTMDGIKNDMLKIWRNPMYLLKNKTRTKATIKRAITQLRDGNLRQAGAAIIQRATYMESKVQ